MVSSTVRFVIVHYSALRVEIRNSKCEFLNHLAFVFSFMVCD